MSAEITRDEAISAIRRRAHNTAIRAMLAGQLAIRLSYEEADALGEQAASWVRARGLRWVDVGGSIEVGQ